MNVWFALALITCVIAIGNLVADHLCASGVLPPGGWVGYAARDATNAEWQGMHRAALPAYWVSAALAVPTAIVGGLVTGWGPASGVSSFVALVVVGCGVAVGAILARRDYTRTRSVPAARS